MNETSEAKGEHPLDQPDFSGPRAYDPRDIEDNKFVAALSYIGILFLVPLLAKRDSPYSQFHAKQGLVMALIFFVGSFVFWFPIFGWLGFLFLAVLDIMALVRTLQGKAWEIPIVSDLAKKINI